MPSILHLAVVLIIQIVQEAKYYKERYYHIRSKKSISGKSRGNSKIVDKKIKWEYIDRKRGNMERVIVEVKNNNLELLLELLKKFDFIHKIEKEKTFTDRVVPK